MRSTQSIEVPAPSSSVSLPRTRATMPNADLRRAVPLMIVIVLGLAVNFGQGIRLGQADTLFYPMDRTRVALAIALSMLRDPPAHGYQAYDAVNSLLLKSGLYIGGSDDDQQRRETLFRDTDRINKIIAAGLTIPVDPQRQSIALHANDLGYIDFMGTAFRLFGAQVSSLYYFYMLLLIASATAFTVEFRNSRFLLYCLPLYLGIHLFLIGYCSEFGPKIGSIANSRIFTGLALLPALHLACQAFCAAKPRLRSAATAAVQAGVLAFLFTCRFETAWEVGFVVAAVAMAAAASFFQRATRGLSLPRRLILLWPGAVLLIAIAGLELRQSAIAGPAYHNDTGYHLVWDTVLTGILRKDPALFQKYTGLDRHPSDGDEIACIAVDYDRQQASGSTGKQDWPYDCGSVANLSNKDVRDYEHDARRVVLKIIRQNPLALFRFLPSKLAEQVEEFDPQQSFTAARLEFPGFVILLSAIAYAVAGGFTSTPRQLGRLLGGGGLLLACALVDPLIDTSILELGTLASYMLVLLAAVSGVISLVASTVVRYANPRRQALPADALR